MDARNVLLFTWALGLALASVSGRDALATPRSVESAAAVAGDTLTSAVPWLEVVATVSTAGDEHVWTFSGEAGQVVAVDVLVPDGALGGVVLLRRKGHAAHLQDAVYGNAWTRFGTVGAQERRHVGLTAALPEAGRYEIIVGPLDVAPPTTGSYTLRFGLVRPAERIEVALNAAAFPAAQTGFVRAAVRAALPGGTVAVRAGRYESVGATSGALLVRTPGLTIEGDGRDATVLSTPQASSVFVRVEQPGVTLRRLTVETPVRPPTTIAVGVQLAASPQAASPTGQADSFTLEEAAVRQPPNRGAAMAVVATGGIHDVTLRESVFDVRGDNAIELVGDRATVTGSALNEAYASPDAYGAGTGIRIRGDRATVTDNRIASNLSAPGAFAGVGTGVYIEGSGAVVSGNAIVFSRGSGIEIRGGGLYAFNTADVHDNVVRPAWTWVSELHVGLRIFGVHEARLSGNVVSSRGSARCLELHDTGGRLVNNVLVQPNGTVLRYVKTAMPSGGVLYPPSLTLVNNTFRTPWRAGSGTLVEFVDRTADPIPLLIYNNVFQSVQPDTPPLTVTGVTTGARLAYADYNLFDGVDFPYVGTGIGPDPDRRRGRHDVHGAALFEGPDGAVLDPRSPAVDAGLTPEEGDWAQVADLRLFLPDEDCCGHARPQGGRMDIGAYESPKALRITGPGARPAADTLRHGDWLEVAWRAVNVEDVAIAFSPDSGRTWTHLARYPAVRGRYRWVVPDTSFGPVLFAVREAGQASPADTVGPFVVASGDLDQRWLHMRRSDGSVEWFFPDLHGWRFPNARAAMWPPSHYLSLPDGYPYPWNDRSEFPSFDQFCSAFDIQCVEDVLGVAVVNDWYGLYWDGLSGDWGGSCYGFAASSLLYFDGYLDAEAFLFDQFDSFSAANTFALPTRAQRNLVNRYYSTQFGEARQDHIDEVYDHTPLQTLATVKASFDDYGDHIALILKNFVEEDDWWPEAGHAVVPYRVVEDADSAFIYVYDNNDPGSLEARIAIDKRTDRWSYHGLRNVDATDTTDWGGPRGLLPDASIRLFRERMAFKNGSGAPRALASGTVTQVFATPVHDLLLTGEGGARIGFEDGEGGAFGRPVVPADPGYPYERPLGYRIPAGPFAARLQVGADTAAGLRVYTAGRAVSYERSTASTGETDHLAFGDAVAVGSGDPSEKTFALTTLLPAADGLRTVAVEEARMGQGDSLRVRVGDGTAPAVENHGSESTYRLRLERLTRGAHTVFRSSRIPLPPDTRHEVHPAWAALARDPVAILVDRGMDGTVEDTLYAVYMTTDAEASDASVLPQTIALHPNYPNPFNPSTTVPYEVPVTAHVRLAIYDVLGRELRVLVDGVQAPGRYEVAFDAARLPSGTYFCRLTAAGLVRTRALVLLK